MSDSHANDEGSSTSSAASVYQRASQAYYDKMRRSHTSVYCSKSRMEDERSKKRYTHVQPPELEAYVQNLSSFITLLLKLCGPGPSVSGIDFGCGSHWFVDFVRTDPAFGWSAVGYDPDKCAIELAHQQFPASANFYRCLDPIRSDLPESAESQSFVFCNAVLQHFDDRETQRSISEVSRVLQPGGVCMLIFKCWDEELLHGDGGMARAPQVLDAANHQVLFFDPTMNETIKKLSDTEQLTLDDQTREGWRMFHLFSVEQIIEMADRHGLVVISDIRFDGRNGVRGIVTYRSGKRMPTACVVFSKALI